MSTYTETDLQIISAAIKTGAKKIRLNNREIEYQSISQMLKAKREIEADLQMQGQANGTRRRRPRSFRASLNKGL